MRLRLASEFAPFSVVESLDGIKNLAQFRLSKYLNIVTN